MKESGDIKQRISLFFHKENKEQQVPEAEVPEKPKGVLAKFWDVILILCLVYLLYVPAFNRMITSSYANALCEKYLNTKIEGAATNIGLRPDDWDDTEYIPQDDEE